MPNRREEKISTTRLSLTKQLWGRQVKASRWFRLMKKSTSGAAFPATPVDFFITDFICHLRDLIDQVTHEISRGKNAQVEAKNCGHHRYQIVTMLFCVCCSCGHIDSSSNMSLSW